jgi:Fructose-bisphosphate aldolase class-I
MTSHALESVALTLVGGGKGILAADETVPTLTKRFDTLGIRSTEQSRRTSREMLFTCPGAAEFIGGAIMYDETIRQKSASGAPLAEALTVQGILPGIKVDTGAQPLAGSPNEIVTEGLDGLRDRLKEYRNRGARFAKWRALIRVIDALPSAACVSANAHALARYTSHLSRAGGRADRRARSAHGWTANHRALRGGDRCGPSRGVPRPLRAGCRRRGDTAQAQHGHRWQGVRPPRLGGRGRRRDIALFAPACACRGAWDRILGQRARLAPPI